MLLVPTRYIVTALGVAMCAVSLWGGTTAQAVPRVVPTEILAEMRARAAADQAALKQGRAALVKAAGGHATAQVHTSELRQIQSGLSSAWGQIAMMSRNRPQPVALDTLIKPAQQRERALRDTLDTRTSAAARIQIRLHQQQRQIAAFDTALRGYRGDPDGPNGGNVFPSFGWGGPRTSPVTAESIDRYLESKASPIAGSGVDFMKSGVKWNIDPRFVVAVSGAESYFGLQLCAPYNAWGWGCPNGPYRFASWAQAIEAISKGLRTGYLDDGLISVDRIHLRYAPPAAANDPTGLNYAWPNNVARFLNEQGGNVEDVAGPEHR